MRILAVATKSPWPPDDGGRLALWLTLQGLAEAGHDVALIAPVERADPAMADALSTFCTPTLVPLAARSWPRAAAHALLGGHALTTARHRRRELQDAVARCVRDWRPDVVHAEQLQAYANCAPAADAGVPVVLRMQNVESSLWTQYAATRPQARALAWEARRLQRDERAALSSAAGVVALTAVDADALRALAPDARVAAVPPPFPASLPSAAAIDGGPAIVLSGSAGWRPNDDALEWFLDAIAPALRTAHPGAAIHVFGGRRHDAPGVHVHAAPVAAIDAFPDGAIAVLPLRIASGIRMRILEAWARGVPVVATAIAASGLDVAHGRELLIADTPEQFVDAIGRVQHEPGLRAALIAAGRAYLRARHDAAATTEALVAEYRRVVGLFAKT